MKSWWAHFGLEEFFCLRCGFLFCETKVCNFGREVGVDEDVGRLEVAVVHTAHVHVVHAHQHAQYDVLSLLLGKWNAFLVQDVEKGAVFH